MNLRGLLFIFLCFQVSAQEPETDIFAEVAKLAKTDAVAAVEMLRTTENLEPEGIYESFSNLDAAAHFRLLHEICKDEALANRFVFGWLAFSPTVNYEGVERPSPDLEAKDIFPIINEAHIAPLLLAAPDDMPPVLTIPALGTVLKFNQLIFGLAMYADPESGLSKDEILDVLLKDVKTETIPERYHEVLKLITAVSQVDLPEANDRKKSQEASARIAALLEKENIPISVRLGFVGLGEDSRKCRSDETAIRIANWLAEALEKDIPVGYDRTQSLLKRFLDAQRHPDWKHTAVRILDASAELNSQDAQSHSWLIGIAATLGDRDQIEKLKATAPESTRALAVDPAFFILVREGFFDLANQEIEERNRELLLTKFNDFLRYSSGFQLVSFDEELESSTTEFLKTITNADVKFIAELHLKLLPDNPDFPPQTNQAERIRKIALQVKDMEFEVPEAKYTALRMIGNFPESAGQIADTYIAYSQFDRIDKNLNDIFRDEAWSELAIDTFKAVLAAKRYEDAEMVLRKIAESTARLEGNFFRRAHNNLWGKLVRDFSEKFEAEGSPIELLPIARFLNQLPRMNFLPTEHYVRGKLIKITIAKHAEYDRMSEWWKSYADIPPADRKAYDLTFINHILGKDVVVDGSGDWGEAPPFEPDLETRPLLELVRTFQDVPYNQPAEARIAAAIRACRTVTPAAIAIFHNYRYLSAEEILANADKFAAALPEENSRKWSDLARIACEAGNEELTKKFLEKAK